MAIVAANQGRLKYSTREKNPTNEELMKYYSETFDAEYTATTDGETNITLDIPVNSEVIQIEREIKPIHRSKWSYNVSTRLLVLDDSVALSAGETLFVIYKRIISS